MNGNKAHKLIAPILVLGIAFIIVLVVAANPLEQFMMRLEAAHETLLGSLVIWSIAAVASYVVLTTVLPFLTRKTETEIDDIIVGILRWPLPLVVILYGLDDILHLVTLPSGAFSFLTRVDDFMLVVIGAYLVLKLFSGVIAVFAQDYAKHSESNLDDVLVPLLTKMIVPLLVIIVTTIAGLYVLGVDLGGVLISLGALSFLLVFLFQEPMSNLFGGVFLITDVPFKYGDLLILEDDRTYRVEEIGARVTRLYSTEDHTLAFVPNTKLAAQRLINLTRPNVELRVKMQIGVGYNTESLERVQEILVEAANLHPHVLGDLGSKLEAMTDELNRQTDESSKLRLRMEIDRLQVEHQIRDRCEELIRRLQFLSQFVKRLEFGGLDMAERKSIYGNLENITVSVSDMIRRMTVWIHLVGRLEAMYKFKPLVSLSATEIEQRLPSQSEVDSWLREDTRDKDVERKITEQLLAKGNLVIIGTFHDIDDEFFLAGSAVWLNFSEEVRTQGAHASTNVSLQDWRNTQPAWVNFKDFYEFYRTWHRPVRELLRRLRDCRNLENVRGEREYHLHIRIAEIVKLLEQRFLLHIPAWQMPDADFIGFGSSSIDFRLEFFVDDLVRDHFERLNDVFSEVGLVIRRRLRQEDIEIPFPQTDIWFRDDWVKDLAKSKTVGPVDKSHQKPE